MIVDVSMQLEARYRDDFIVPGPQRPKYCHGSKENAEKELLRLREKHSGGVFVLMESIAFAKIGDTAIKTIYVEPM